MNLMRITHEMLNFNMFLLTGFY